MARNTSGLRQGRPKGAKDRAPEDSGQLVRGEMKALGCTRRIGQMEVDRILLRMSAEERNYFYDLIQCNASNGEIAEWMQRDLKADVNTRQVGSWRKKRLPGGREAQLINGMAIHWRGIDRLGLLNTALGKAANLVILLLEASDASLVAQLKEEGADRVIGASIGLLRELRALSAELSVVERVRDAQDDRLNGAYVAIEEITKILGPEQADLTAQIAATVYDRLRNPNQS
jgi:hypothetical protein